MLGVGSAWNFSCAWGAKRPDQLDAMASLMELKLDDGAMIEIDRIVMESVTDPIGTEYLTPRTREQ
jgi:hypothetical protein